WVGYAAAGWCLCACGGLVGVVAFVRQVAEGCGQAPVLGHRRLGVGVVGQARRRGESAVLARGDVPVGRQRRFLSAHGALARFVHPVQVHLGSTEVALAPVLRRGERVLQTLIVLAVWLGLGDTGQFTGLGQRSLLLRSH